MDLSLIKRKLPLIVFICSVLFLGGGYIIYEKVIQAKLDNISTQTMKIDLKNSDLVYQITKHATQKNIFQIEMTITGKSSDFITLYLGSKPGFYTKEVRLKKGEIDFTFIDDWYSENAYVKIESAGTISGELELEYQFLGMTNDTK